MDPQFLRADVPLEISFVVAGAVPKSVTYDIGGQLFECDLERRNARFVCVHPGFGRDDLAQGTSLVVVEARDEEGNTAIATGQVTVDFDCPRFLGLRLNPPISEPGGTVVLDVEASETLRGPPRVTRNGIDWETAVGDGRSFTVTHEVTVGDPAPSSAVVVRLIDRAGNTTADCGTDGAIPFAVDHTPPITAPQGILLERDAPGRPATLRAEAGTFQDDVGLDHVRVLDATGERLIATLTPAADGSLEPTSLGGTTDSRVLVEAIDRFGRQSPRLSIPERWRLSVGAGNTPGAAMRTAVRFTPAPPDSPSMRNRTVELAPDVFQSDTRAAIVRGHVGFEKVGDLPTRYEGVNSIMAGYEPVGRSVIGVGGYDGTDYVFFDEYFDDTIILRWDEREGAYLTEQGPGLSYSDPSAPAPRYGVNLAFDGTGCGVMVGGDARIEELNARVVADVWQLCLTNGVYQWTEIPLAPTVGGQELFLIYPVIWDPLNARYVIAGGDRILFLEPGPDSSSWSWREVTPLPTSYGSRSGHFLYWEPRLEGFAIGLGNVSPANYASLTWTYRSGQWSQSTVPFDLDFRSRFGWAFDEARQRLVVWGGADYPDELAEEEVRYLVGSSTSGPSNWRTAEVDHPVARDFPSLVYDPDREVVVVFGGVRSQDNRVVPPEIHQLISEPSFPHLQASIDLAASRPKGIDLLHLEVRALGLGDADGVGAGTERSGGVRLLLWDHDARAWQEVAASGGAPGSFDTITVDVRSDPERFVSPSGTVPITVVPVGPATELVDGRLEVDLIDGYLELRGGVAL